MYTGTVLEKLYFKFTFIYMETSLKIDIETNEFKNEFKSLDKIIG